MSECQYCGTDLDGDGNICDACFAEVNKPALSVVTRDDAKACEAHPDRTPWPAIATCPATGEDHWYEVEYPEDMQLAGGARRWVFRCQECGAISDKEVPVSMRRRGI